MSTRTLRLAIASALLLPASLSAARYRNFSVAVYARAYEVRQMKDLKWLEERWNVIANQMKVDKVYLEVHRDGVMPDAETIESVKRFFAGRGVKTAAGIATVVNERNRFQTFCYTTPEQREKVKQIAEFAARHFDEIILDDFFFTSCKCDSCIRAKGDKSWTRFRLDLMEEVSRDLIIGPARAVNPNVRLTIKYPNWYEHYQALGYNVEKEAKLFDKVYTGTETRDAVYNNQHLQPYLGYDLFRWLENAKPGGNAGGWVDPANRRTLDRYAEQLWITLFAKAPEITLFDFRQLIEPIRDVDGASTPATEIGRVAGYVFDQVDGFAGKLGRPIGVKSYKPYHSSGEDFLHDFLGMAGIPIDLTPVFPTDAGTVLLTESAKFDSGIVGRIKNQLTAGKNVVITSGLLKVLQDRGIRDIVELEYTDRKASVRDFWQRASIEQAESGIIIPEIRYPTNDAWEIVSTLDKGIGYPILLQAAYSKGQLYVLTIPDNFGDLYNFPPEALSRIRQVLTADLPVRLEAPAQIALYVYDNNSFIVESFLPHMAMVGISLDKRFKNLRDLTGAAGGFFGQTTAQVRGDRVVFETMLRPHSYRVFAAE